MRNPWVPISTGTGHKVVFKMKSLGLAREGHCLQNAGAGPSELNCVSQVIHVRDQKADSELRITSWNTLLSKNDKAIPLVSQL
jgi:hypothetical protein